MDELTPEDPMLDVEVSVAQDGALATVTVVLAGELDMSNLNRVDDAVAPALAADPGRLVVKATRLTFADSSAIALWLRWASSVERFELHDPPPPLRRVLSAMGLAEKLGLS